MVTTPSAAIVMNASGESGAAGPPNCASASAGSRCRAIIIPPPVIALTRRKERRESGFCVMAAPLLRCARGLRGPRRLDACGPLDRFANTYVSATAAQVALHRRVDLGVTRLRRSRQQRRRRHDLPRLAVATLRDVQFLPRRLHGMTPVGRQPLDRRHLLVADGRHRNRAGTGGDTV